MLWPTRLASPTPAASMSATSQSAIAGIVGRGGPAGAAVAGQVDRQHAAAVPGEVARLQLPDRVIEGGAVHEDGHRQVGVERPAAGGGEGAARR